MGMDWLTWVQVVELPVLGYVLWLIYRGKDDARDAAKALKDAQDKLAAEISRVRSAGAHELAEFKLQVAKEYASVAYLKDVETRLIDALQRIEDKLDRRARVDG